MSDPRFLPKTNDFYALLSHLVEECGETLGAAGKTLRYGWAGVNPLLPEAEQESNLIWLKREIADLKQAISRLEACIEADDLP